MATIRCSKNLFSRAQRFLCVRLISSDGANPSNPPKGPVGFVGLGNMGAPMAKNLLDSGCSLIVHDMYPEAVADLKLLGAETASTPSEVASRTKQIVTMLPSSPNVEEVYAGEHGILKSVQEGTLLIDSSTIDPTVSKSMATLAESKGAMYLDAPVSGGVNAAKTGVLTFMVGGKEAGFEEAKPILEQMGKNVVHTGQVGTGQAAKICNNMLLAISMIGVSEAMNLGIRLGLDASMIAEIINTSSGRCWSSDTYNPCPGVMPGVPSSNNYQGGFGTALMAKDLGLAQNAATSTKTATPLGSLAHQLYRIMCNKGYSKLDFASVFKFLKEEQ